MKLLTYSDWCDTHGTPYITPKFSSGKGARGVDVSRCQAIAATKNSKIRKANDGAYAAYVAQWEEDGGDIATLAEDPHDFSQVMLWVQRDRGREAACAVIERSGYYVKNEGGTYARKTPVAL